MIVSRSTIVRFAVTLVGAAVLVLAPAAASAGRYLDPTGDSGTSPDITGVTVASDASGLILFTIDLADLLDGSGARTFLLLDTDEDGATGAPDSVGSDYVFVVDDDGYNFAHWTGAAWDNDTAYATVRVFTSRTHVTISVNRSELGNTKAFNFWVRTRLGDEDMDTAPEESVWNYSLAADGPDVQSVLVATAPSAGPKAGKTFTVTPVSLKLPPSGEPPLLLPRPDSYTCRATLAGRAIAGTGTGGCEWKLPLTARKKSLNVVLTVKYQGATKSITFTYRVS
jgi:hypothetical protein